MLQSCCKSPDLYGNQEEKKQVYSKWDPVTRRMIEIRIIPPIPLGVYSWMLIDNTNQVWVSDSDFSNLRSNGYQIPLGSNYWGYGETYNQKCLWTGTYWLFTNRVTNTLIRSDVNLTSWDTVSGLVRNNQHDLTTDGGSKVVFLNKRLTNSYISTDKGQTWNTSFVLPDNTFDFGHKVYYDGSVMLVSRMPNIIRSTNNGVTFQGVLTVSGPGLILCFCRLPNGTFYATGRNYYWTSTDNGLTWTQNNIGTGVTNRLIGEILYDGSKYVALGLYDGPIWSTNGVNWTKHTTSDGSVLNGYDYDYNRLHFNGTSYAFRNGTNNRLYKSFDGKVWSSLTHPTAGRWFIDAYPKAQDVNLNIK